MLILTFAIAAVLFCSSFAELDFEARKYDLIYQGKSLAEFVETSRAMGIEVQCRKPNMIAITFDDGIREETETILDVLDKHKVEASFFIIGQTLNSFPKAQAILKRMKRSRHTVATHSIAHADLSWMTAEEVLRNYEEPSRAIKELIGVKPRCVRPPFGYYNQGVMDVARQNGYKVINWNYDSNDWRHGRYSDQRPIVDAIISAEGEQKSSKIILFHDHILQPDVLSQIIKFYKKKGYNLVNMRDCLGSSVEF